MRLRKKNIRGRKERALTSDALPFEVPITFTNRYFFRFVRENKIEICENNRLRWKEGEDCVSDVIRILFSLPSESDSPHVSENGFNTLDLSANANTRPFSFLIHHKGDQFRELSIPHPRSQLELVKFYNDYKEVILYYTSLSSFSIRKPVKVASAVYYKDRKHQSRLSLESTGVEEVDKEYENLRSYFVYGDYNNVYKFYESRKFHRCEKKYNNLKKLDVSDCFNSIYSHSITWAIIGKDKTKENLSLSKETFPGKFDRLMQRSNSNETNGILIGPEYSRIFAELILQAIDKQLEAELFSKHNLSHKTDYEIFRYVDDYFIFFNKSNDCSQIESCLQRLLKEYKLRLNTAKSKLYDKPIITEISRAKLRVVELLKKKIELKLEEESQVSDLENIVTGSIYINPTRLITDYKTILRECEVEYMDMINYTLSVVERRLNSVFKSFELILPENRQQNSMTKALMAVIEFSFFIASVSPRVNTTIKLCRIVRVIIDFLRKMGFTPENKNALYKIVYDDAHFIMKKFKTSEHTQVETLYLLAIIAELGKDFRLEQDVLAGFFNIHRKKGKTRFISKQNLNYFSFTVLMFYMKDKKRYSDLRLFVEDETFKYLKTISGKEYKFAECIMTGLDFISCPYATTDTKHRILKEVFSVDSSSRRTNLIEMKGSNCRRQLWFTTWTNFDYGSELDAKLSLEVY